MIRQIKPILRATLVALAIGTATLGSSYLIAPTALAESKAASGEVLTQSEPVKGAYFGGGSTVQLTSDVDGDAYIAGQTVTISGNITGDILVAGQTVVVSGKITGDARIIAQNVTVSSPITGTLSIAAQSVTITDTATIGKDVALAVQTATINGKIARDVQAAVGVLTVNGTIGRNLSYMSDTEAVRDGASIGGSVNRTDVPTDTQPTAAEMIGARLASFLYTILALGFAMLLLGLLVPSRLAAIVAAAFPKPWQALLAGLIFLAVTPPVLFFLALSVIGIPVAITGALIYLLVIMLSPIVASLYIGRLLYKDEQSVLIQGLTGVLVYGMLLSLPIVNAITMLFGTLLGSGALALSLRRHLGGTPAISTHHVSEKPKQ